MEISKGTYLAICQQLELTTSDFSAIYIIHCSRWRMNINMERVILKEVPLWWTVAHIK
jgi:hypothetical protein